jgi:hypothetical protein
MFVSDVHVRAILTNVVEDQPRRKNRPAIMKVSTEHVDDVESLVTFPRVAYGQPDDGRTRRETTKCLEESNEVLEYFFRVCDDVAVTDVLQIVDTDNAVPNFRSLSSVSVSVLHLVEEHTAVSVSAAMVDIRFEASIGELVQSPAVRWYVQTSVDAGWSRPLTTRFETAVFRDVCLTQQAIRQDGYN